VTKDDIEAALAKLTRLDIEGDFEGGYGLAPCECGEPGEYVRFDDVREMLEGLIDAPQAG
jgi:hypothetical protein